jgi:lauroyl/myristoyl acyltransferase
VLRALTRRLAANRVVSITVTAWGVKACTAPFLRGVLHVATGAPGLALRTGAPLLPVFTVREESGSFLTIVEPPIEPRENGDREQALQEIIASLIRRIEHHTRCWPDQFHWHQDITGRHRSSE